MDKGGLDYQGSKGILGECCKDPSLSGYQLLSHYRMDEISFIEPVDHHRDIQGCRGIDPI